MDTKYSKVPDNEVLDLSNEEMTSLLNNDMNKWLPTK